MGQRNQRRCDAMNPKCTNNKCARWDSIVLCLILTINMYKLIIFIAKLCKRQYETYLKLKNNASPPIN